MTINLSKGERINLAKEAPSLKNAGIGLGWDLNATDTGSAFDLDASVFMLGTNGKILNEKYLIFYNNTVSPDGSVKHEGDSLTGEGAGDDETLQIELSKVNASIQEIVFVVTIHEAEQRKQNFGQIKNSFIRIYDNATEKEIAKYELEENASTETAIEFGKLYKKDGEWRFQAVGDGYKSGLQSFVDKYAS